jgi:hypothetical protein
MDGSYFDLIVFDLLMLFASPGMSLCKLQFRFA